MSIVPLVVLDLDERDPRRVAADLTAAIEATGNGQVSQRLRALRNQIEAQTKPPRIPEPALWGVVEATVEGIPRRRWVHHEEERWVCDTGERRDWEDLRDPELVREGVTA